MSTEAEDAAQWRSLRKEVQRFAVAMEGKLRENDHKGGWKHLDLSYLQGRLSEESHELLLAIREWRNDRSTTLRNAMRVELVLGESADVANFCMMLADVCGGLEKP